MSKKKDQVKFLKKSFRSVIKALEKEKRKKKRNEAFEYLTGLLAGYQAYVDETATAGGKDEAAEATADKHITAGVQPSPALVEQIRAEHQHRQQ